MSKFEPLSKSFIKSTFMYFSIFVCVVINFNCQAQSSNRILKDNYGIQINNTKKLNFKVKIITTSNIAIKGFLVALTEDSVKLSSYRFLAVNKFVEEVITISISKIKSIKIGQALRILKNIGIASGIVVGASFTADIIIGFIMGFTYFGLPTVVLSILALPTAILIGTLVGELQKTKVVFNGDKHKFKVEKEMLERYMNLRVKTL